MEGASTGNAPSLSPPTGLSAPAAHNPFSVGSALCRDASPGVDKMTVDVKNYQTSPAALGPKVLLLMIPLIHPPDSYSNSLPSLDTYDDFT